LVKAKKADGDRREVVLNFDLQIVGEAGHENSRNLDLDLTTGGDEQVIELRDLECPYCNSVDVTVSLNLAGNDDRTLVVQRAPDRGKIKEIGALVVALCFLVLSIPEKTRPVAIPGLCLVGAYYFTRNTRKRR
jgi:hypothetical protein